MNYFVYVKDILGVRTNLDQFSWNYGTIAPKASAEEFNKCKMKVNIEVRKSNDVFDYTIDKENYDKYNYFFAKKNQRKIYYYRDFLFNSKLGFSIEIIDNCNINVVVSKNYYKYVKYRFMNIHSIGYILTDLVSGLLLVNGYCSIHCSAVRLNNKTLVIFAPSNTGKTLTATRLCLQEGAEFITEDIAITDGENIYSAPWTSTFSYYNQEKYSKFDKLVDILQDKIMLLQLILLRKKKSAEEFFGKNNILDSSKITDIVLLGKGQNQVVKNKEGMFESIINLNKYEFNYHKSPSMLVFEYFNPDLSIEKMFNIEKTILNNLLNNTNGYRVYTNCPLDYTKLITDKIIFSE